jgi:hypothetical protein
MPKSFEEKLKENRCDFCQNSIDEDSVVCEHQIVCLDCIESGKGKLYYFKCVYCIMEKGEWNEEWDSWTELVGRLNRLFELGRRDGYESINQKYYNMKKDGVSSETKLFNKIYSDGYKMGIYEQKAGIIVEIDNHHCDYCDGLE